MNGSLPKIRQQNGFVETKRKRRAADELLQAHITMALPLGDRIIYGPVRSRRLGRSLGINLLPAGVKICNMNCAYCQYGWTRGRGRRAGDAGGWPATAAIEGAVLN